MKDSGRSADSAMATAIRELVESRLKSACDLLGRLKLEGARTRAQAKEGYGRLLDSHALVTGTIYEALMRHNGKVGKTSESISQRLLLLGSFVQGIDLCETSITEGFYVQAAALLKQELETVAAIREVMDGKRADGKTPNTTTPSSNIQLRKKIPFSP